MASDPLITYRFYATALNFNGEGAASGVALLRSCTWPSSGPKDFSAPTVESVTSTLVEISWSSPADGGCPILGYAIYVDDSAGVFAEYDAVNVRGKPFLSSYAIDMSSKVAGLTY